MPRRAAAEDPLNVLAIDQGTSATKAVLVGPGQQVLGAAEVPVRVRAVGASGVEADPEELYASVLSAGSQALAAARAPAHAIALANQGETVLAWDRRTGRPLTPAIVWQDGRSAGVCARLAGSAGRLAEITGLRLDPYFAAPKMTWLRENLTSGGVVTTTDTWLLARLGAGYVTDAATASRTLLLDLDSTAWSAEACAIFGLDPGELPEVTDCAGITGETTAFGPALPVLTYRTVPEAIERANATNYGLGASVWSSDPLRAAEVAEKLEAGTVWINTHMQLTHDAPFTGMKWSGLGSEMGLWSIYAYTDPQTVFQARSHSGMPIAGLAPSTSDFS